MPTVQRAQCTAPIVTKGGQFKLPDISAGEMQQRVKGKLQEAGFPAFVTWLFIRKIPNLTRWNK